MTNTITLITGANRGIGAVTAQRLARLGHTVIVASRDLAAGQRTVESFGPDVDAGAVELDVTDDASVARAADQVLARFGRIDVLVSNAGISGPRREIADLTATDAQQVLGTNVVGTVRVLHAFLPLLGASEHPVVVVVGSGNGSFGLFHDESRIESQTGMPLYAASKSALNMLVARYAKLLPAIRINIADPGQTATDFTGGQGHSLEEGTDAIVELATLGPDGPTGTYRDRDGTLPW